LGEEESVMNYKMIIVLIFTGLAVLFIIQNVTVVEIKFIFWSFQMSRALLMFILLAIGFIIGWFMHGHLKHKKNMGNN
jgi:uncharacterized integral membrane protein